MYPKNDETNYEAPEIKRIIRKAGKEKNERAFIFKKPVFQPLKRLEKQGIVNKNY